jgi:hypothetical protein
MPKAKTNVEKPPKKEKPVTQKSNIILIFRGKEAKEEER